MERLILYLYSSMDVENSELYMIMNFNFTTVDKRI